MQTCEDPILQEFPVFFSDELAEKLLLFQFPTLMHENPFFCSEKPLGFRARPKNKLYELDLPVEVEGNSQYDLDKGRELANSSQSSLDQPKVEKLFDKMTFASQAIPPSPLVHLIGFHRKGQIHLTPLHQIHQMRPSMKYLDEIDANSKQASRKLMQEEARSSVAAGELAEGPSSASKALQVQFKRKETDEELSMRLKSFSFYQKTIQEEPWKTCQYFPLQTNESLKAINKLLSPNQNVHFPLEEGKKEFFDRLFPIVQHSVAIANASLHSLKLQPLSIRIKALMQNLRIASWQRMQELLEIHSEDSTKNAAALQELESCCHLIGGRWILKSELIPSCSKLICNARNVLLGLFLQAEQQNTLLERHNFCQIVKLTLDTETMLFNEIAILHASSEQRGWKLKVEKDEEFIQSHPGIVQRQTTAFEGILNNAMEFFSSEKQHSEPTMVADSCNREGEREPSRRGRKPKGK